MTRDSCRCLGTTWSHVLVRKQAEFRFRGLRLPGFRPVPGVSRVQLKGVVERLGMSGACNHLGIGESVLFRALNRQPVAADVTRRIQTSLAQYEELEKRLQSSSGRIERPVFSKTKAAAKVATPAVASALSETTRTELVFIFKALLDRRAEFDPTGGLDVESLACGFFLALGVDDKAARSLSYLVSSPEFFKEGKTDGVPEQPKPKKRRSA